MTAALTPAAPPSSCRTDIGSDENRGKAHSHDTTNATVAPENPLYPSTRGGKAATAPEPQARAAE